MFGSGIGGNDTTRNAISVGIPALNENPEQHDEHRDDRSLIPSFVDKVIRWQTPLAHTRRPDLGKPFRTALDAAQSARPRHPLRRGIPRLQPLFAELEDDPSLIEQTA